MGCVYYYTITKGLNLKENNYVLVTKEDCDIILVNAMITKMTNIDPKQRITADNVAINPIFWKSEKVLNLIVDISNRFEKRDSLCNKIKREMSSNESEIVRGDWLQKLDSKIVKNLQERRGYNGCSVVDLVRAIRNKRAHYEETPKEIKDLFGKLPDGYLNYWLQRFPRLLNSLYELANKFLIDDPTFNMYLGH